jgi:lambda family phage tail tape measure protein
MATIEDFILRFKTVGTEKIKQAGDSVNDLKNDLSSFAQIGGPVGNTLNGIVARLGPVGLAAAAAGTALSLLGGKALSLASEMGDIAGATGIAAGTIANFKTSVILAGGSSEDAGQLLQKLTQSISEAASGSETAQKSFRDLGVFVRDASGEVREGEDILKDLVARFQEGKLTSDEFNAALDILGKNFRKLESAKLTALPDPELDAAIEQLDKINDQIDILFQNINKKIIKGFGDFAQAINDGGIVGGLAAIVEGLANLSGEILNLPTDYLAKFLNLFGANIKDPVGLGTPLKIAAEQARKDRLAFNEEQKKAEAALKARADFAKNDPRRGSQGGKSGAKTPGGAGDFGATPPAVLADIREREKRNAIALEEIKKNALLTGNTERLKTLLDFADKESAIKLKEETDLRELDIKNASDIAKARLEIFSKERGTALEKEKEFQLKKLELETQTETQRANIRLAGAEAIKREQEAVAEKAKREAEQLAKEKERIEEIIRTSKARITEEQTLNNQIKERNELLNATLGDTDRARNNLQALVDIEENREEILRRIRQIKDLPEADRAAREREINAIFEERLAITEKQQEQDLKNQENFSKGFEKAFKTYAESAKNNFETAGRVFGKITQGMEDSIVDFAKTGKFEFRGFLNSVLEELLRSQVRSLIAQTFGGLFGSTSKRGTVTIGDLIPGFASGGLIGTNGPVIVGERGPELLVGAGGNRVIPNDQLASGTVNYNISAVDAQSFKQLVASDPSFIYAVTEQGRRTIPSGRR